MPQRNIIRTFPAFLFEENGKRFGLSDEAYLKYRQITGQAGACFKEIQFRKEDITMSKRNRLIMVLAVLLISLLSAGCGKQENTKKPEDLQATPTAGVSAVPEEKYVTSVKGYPTEPEAGSEMEQVWKVKSYFEEYLFDRDGKCTAFEQECVLCSAEDYENTNKALADGGYTVTWSENNLSFRITLEKKDFTVADAKKGF